MAHYDIVAGTTTTIDFQLLESGAPIVLTGATITLLLSDRTGTTVSSPGATAIVDAVNGKVKLTPTDANVFDPALGPYLARWVITDAGSLVSYVPTGSHRDIWNIVRA